MLRRLTTTAALIGVTAALTACGPDNPKPPPFTPSLAPSSSATPTADPEAVGSAAVAAYRRYLDVLGKMTSSGGIDTKDLPAVAADVELAVSQNQADTYRGRKIKSVGSLKVVWAKPSEIGKPVGGQILTASVEACIDASGVDAVDTTGKSVRKPGTPTRWIDTRQLKLFGEQWKVVKGKNEAAKC